MYQGSILCRVERFAARGQVLPLVALALVVLFGAAALAVDVGYLQYKQRVQQTAADSAALGGAIELEYVMAASTNSGQGCVTTITTTNSTVTAAAQKDAGLNGFTDDGGKTVTVTAQQSPQTGTYAGNPCAVEADIVAKHATFFENIFGSSNPLGSVKTRAVAVLESGGLNCVIALQPSGNGLVMNSDKVNAPNCGFISNAKFNLNNSTVDASSIGAVGNIQTNKQSSFPAGQPQAAVAVSDPCLTMAGCAYLTNNPPATTPCAPTPVPTGSSLALSPGVYCGLQLQGLTVTFKPGLYVLTGDLKTDVNSSLQMDTTACPSSSSSTGCGVTFDMASGKLDMNNLGSINLWAPTSGVYQGMLVFQPPSNTQTDTLNAGSGSLSGILYMPTAQVTINSSFNSYFGIIAGSVDMSHSTVNITNNTTWPGIWHAVLAE